MHWADDSLIFITYLSFIFTFIYCRVHWADDSLIFITYLSFIFIFFFYLLQGAFYHLFILTIHFYDLFIAGCIEPKMAAVLSPPALGGSSIQNLDF